MKSFQSNEDALEYFCECSLATVSQIAGMTRRTKCDYRRHIAISQNLVDFLKGRKPGDTSSRRRSVMCLYGGSVNKWAKTYEL